MSRNRGGRDRGVGDGCERVGGEVMKSMNNNDMMDIPCTYLGVCCDFQ